MRLWIVLAADDRDRVCRESKQSVGQPGHHAIAPARAVGWQPSKQVQQIRRKRLFTRSEIQP